MINTDGDLPQADDAIPKDAIRLTDAYERVVDLICDHPELLPKFDEDSAEALRKSREKEKRIQHDQEVFDAELEEYWHHKKEANLILRSAIEEKKLVACVRDAEAGDILQLAATDWIPGNWDDYIPPGIWTDFIVPDDYEAPGPQGSFIGGALRPVFFLREEFEQWLCKTLEFSGPTTTIKANEKIQNYERTRAHQIEAAKEAILDIWGRDGAPNGVTKKLELQQINEWMKNNSRAEISLSSVYRANKLLKRPST
jgi:hypothetical protein